MINKLILATVFSMSVAIFSSGCGRTVSMAEALQLPVSSQLYTNYNIWHESPTDIPSENYHKGKILQFGTPVVVTDVSMGPFWDRSRGTIEFKCKKTGAEYRIIFDQNWMMIPIDEYLRRVFTDKSRDELTKGVNVSVREKLLRGIVEDEMTRKDVLLAYGYPVVHRTPSIMEDTWIFWNARMDSVRVVFKKDKVMAVLKLDEN